MAEETAARPSSSSLDVGLLCDDLWRGAYLFINLTSDGVLDGLKTERIKFQEPSVSFAYYNVLGEPYSWRQRASLMQNFSEEFRGMVEECIVESDTHYGFSVTRIVAKLRPAFFSGLRATSEYERGSELSGYNEHINKIVAALCPSATGEGRVRTARHILYLEPKQTLLPIDWSDQGIDPVPLIERCRDYLSVVRYNEAPVVLEDMIILPAMGYGNRGRSWVSIRLGPIESHWDADLHIPLIPLQFLNHMAGCEIRSSVHSMLQGTDLSNESYWNSFSKWGHFQGYQGEFLKKRLTVETILQRASEIADFMPEDLKATFIHEGDFRSFPGRLRIQNPHVWWAQSTVVEVAREERLSGSRKLDKAVRKVRSRTRILENFLRDVALADVSKASLTSADKNARLASSVTWLTWVILIFTILSVLLSCIPQEVKEAPYDMMIQEMRDAQR